ncbi:nucleotidyl transferase AbiEii/AbiGii toxin family protein [Caldicellulosiruptor owensensis]|uniref:nucleotidyl transferase AbiEii/AbiGii toxin family protein n=1 Tax=Caldicellulosiruptor owensensis TaxID=55205 RepID=UPI00031C5D91|nr:nucleotidyl transferase AbiEii/AbiGii toxin family protein [Caldicellulosiruptor owensensis]
MMDVEILDPIGYEICRNIAKSNLAEKFYLAGGTALALQLCHRKLYDLDFFQKEVSERIKFEYIYNILAKLFPRKDVNIIIKQIDQMTSTRCGVKISFIAYPFPLIEPLVQGDKIDIRLKGINLASPKEIALMKAYTIGRRPTYRDYIVNLECILEKAPQKFVIEGELVFSKKLFF